MLFYRWRKVTGETIPVATFICSNKKGLYEITEYEIDYWERMKPKQLTDKQMLHELSRCDETRSAVYDFLKGKDDDRIKMFLPRKETKVGQINDEMIQRAKQVPIDSLIEIRHGHKMLCLWHADTQPSLSYHKRNNFVKCFACDKYADSIGVYQKINNCDFKTAVKELGK